MTATAATPDSLIRSGVVFDELSHTYTTPDGRSLSGITGILSRQLFPDKYSGISREILDAAASRGSNIHEQIELFDSLGAEPDTPLLQTYASIKERHGLVTVANEYLVSDNLTVASSIDIVFEGWHLCDIKTTSHLDREYVSWQLSIYAFLFELQNPGKQAGRLYAFWYPRSRYGAPDLIEVDRKPDGEIRRLLADEAAGRQFVPGSAADKASIIDSHAELLTRLFAAEKALKDQEAVTKELRQQVMAVMQEASVSSYKDDRLTLTLRKASISQRLDANQLKADHPDIYAAYLKESATKESLTVKLTA